MNAKDILSIRNKLNKSQKEMAEMIGVSLSAYQHWEYGKRNPSKSAVKVLENILHEHDKDSIDCNLALEPQVHYTNNISEVNIFKEAEENLREFIAKYKAIHDKTLTEILDLEKAQIELMKRLKENNNK